MSAQLRIVHHTGYRYAGGANASFNEVRMIPRSTHQQQVLHSRVDIAPVPWTYSYTDYWGTAVTAFEVFERHESLAVTATSIVDVQHVPDAGPGLGWAEVPTGTASSRRCRRGWSRRRSCWSASGPSGSWPPPPAIWPSGWWT